jgi:predicted NAD-dependent protein-ADP-ribosyltransferase YbiA (DUF1768 family)
MKHAKNPKYVEEIRCAPKPFDAFKLGRAKVPSFSNNWEGEKD